MRLSAYYHHHHCCCWLLGLALVLLARPTPGAECAQSGQEAAGATRPAFELPKIFDFQLYKGLFRKSYAGLAEETTRRKYMLARAFRAFISAIKYKHRKLSYHLALNHLSDRSPRELERARNQMVVEGLHEYYGSAGASEALDVAASAAGAPMESEIPDVSPDEIDAGLAQLAQDQASRRRLAMMSAELRPRGPRAKREAPPKGRRVTLDQLISSGAGVQLDPATARKVQLNPVGNNPDYEAPELTSAGKRDEQLEELDWIQLEAPGTPPTNIASYLQANYPVPMEVERAQVNDVDQDVVYFDHRDSKCMFLPRDQGDCGSCYAFGAVAIAEWLYCIKNGHLIPFSEQYIVDCGAGVGNRGCDGGNHFSIGYFLHNYGMELRSNYPYTGRQDACPYDEHTDPKAMGYIRMELGSATIVPVEAFADYIKYSPLFITICTQGDFAEYKAGVHLNPHCNGQQSDHVVVLIGHGREDGQEYWLIRNSHSVGWGEQGHYKLAKQSTVLYPRSGVAFGTTNGVQLHATPSENERNDKQHVRSRYVARLHESLDGDQFD